jgi:HTH-type transcriptional regulator, transcriptional repressor of NAD biosynthesis genes
MSTGLVLGKFMPPHAGHLHLVEFAQAFVTDLTVVVGTLAREPIAGALRHAWMRELAPRARVLHLTDENPQDPSEHPDFWNIWESSLRRLLPHQVDYVFASEVYGEKLAQVLGAKFIPVDPQRIAVPVSGTAIREQPFAHWQHVPRAVRPYFAKRVCVFGPESTGKTTLAKNLAQHFDTVWVPEFARTWLEQQNGIVGPRDMLIIARGQLATEAALARNANRVIVSDTDALLTRVWSEALYNAVDEDVEAAAKHQPAHLYLLTDVDVPWVKDQVRYLPNERESFFARCEQTLKSRNLPYVVVRGTWQERLTLAIDATLAVLR